MSNVLELIKAVRQSGAELRAEPPDLVIKPASRVPPELKALLKANKTAILERLELEESMHGLEAGKVSIAVWDDGSMRVLQSEADGEEAVANGGTICTPQDTYHYIRLDERERRILHTLRFGGTIEWRMEVIKRE